MASETMFTNEATEGQQTVPRDHTLQDAFDEVDATLLQALNDWTDSQREVEVQAPVQDQTFFQSSPVSQEIEGPAQEVQETQVAEDSQTFLPESQQDLFNANEASFLAFLDDEFPEEPPVHCGLPFEESNAIPVEHLVDDNFPTNEGPVQKAGNGQNFFSESQSDFNNLDDAYLLELFNEAIEEGAQAHRNSSFENPIVIPDDPPAERPVAIPEAFPVSFNSPDERLDAILSEDDGAYRGYVTSFEDCLALEEAYLRRQDKSAAFMKGTTCADFPETAEQQHAYVGQLCVAMKNTEQVLDCGRWVQKKGPNGKSIQVDGNQAASEAVLEPAPVIERVVRLRGIEVELLAWKLLMATRDAQLGRLGVGSWTGAISYQKYPCWRDRFNCVLETCKESKAIVMDMTDPQWIGRVARCPDAEIKRKMSNRKINVKRHGESMRGRMSMREQNPDEMLPPVVNPALDAAAARLKTRKRSRAETIDDGERGAKKQRMANAAMPNMAAHAMAAPHIMAPNMMASSMLAPHTMAPGMTAPYTAVPKMAVPKTATPIATPKTATPIATPKMVTSKISTPKMAPHTIATPPSSNTHSPNPSPPKYMAPAKAFEQLKQHVYQRQHGGMTYEQMRAQCARPTMIEDDWCI